MSDKPSKAELAELATVATGPFASVATELAAICIAGAARVSFVHAQFTADCRALAPGASVLTAWCSPQGRVLFLFRLLASADALYALVPRSDAAAFVKRLRMYVLRAAVTLGDLSASHAVVISAGATAPRLPANGLAQGLLGTLAWTVIEHPLPVLELPTVGANALALVMVRAGVPTVDGALAGEFLPQELNLDALGGVSFDKGCYPGQEIIARVRFRGSVKRRLMRYTAEGDQLPVAGARVSDATGATIGTVIMSAWSGPSAFEVLAVRDVGDDAKTRLDGVDLAPATLPYPVGD